MWKMEKKQYMCSITNDMQPYVCIDKSERDSV